MLIFPAILAGRQSTADALPDGTCAEKRCSQSGPPVRFPFQLRGKQPAGINCSYNPGYDLYCDESNRTILELPSSIKFLVTEIDYASQMMQVKPAEYCIAKQLRHLNLSTTPFQFFTSTGPSVFEDKFSLFNCSTKINREVIPGEIIHCLGTPGYTVFWIPLDTDLSGSDLRGCTKIFDTVTVPDVIFFEDSTMNLTWSLPECKNCKNRGGVCGREIKETNQIRCFRHSGRPMKIYYIVGKFCLYRHYY
ncbi:OLC1v1021236C1 [Oldenlandia corymbosa var. corymbosa]|uniref:RING-type E3 ubiquitin transferase n=1 Tax=Oldenlandia corymbosa var. corymbosa TaxID=529605 RepID=A0AAV1BVU4_OLDCO|nr:OLC1v1021236C1 [Oldenlandia corymbosa var. corymbosa]